MHHSTLYSKRYTLNMVATRKSTRQSTSTIGKYAENDSSSTEETGTERNRAQTTRRKRARPDDEEKHVDHEEYATTCIAPRILS
jgi:hypothetical protein